MTATHLQRLIAVIIFWFLAVLILNLSGVLKTDSHALPIPILLAAVGPPALFAVLLSLFGSFKNLVHSIDLRILIALQTLRLGGAMFLILFFLNLLPELCAFPAGLGDMAIGAYAVYVVGVMVKQSPNWRKHAIILNVLGPLAFVTSLGSMLVTSGSPLGIYSNAFTSDILFDLPWVLLPTFVVPFLAICHIASLVKIYKI